MDSRINIFLLNIRSIRYKIPEIHLYLHDLEKKLGITLHILAFTETWAKKEEVFALKIDGYSIFLQDRVLSRGGGVALYFKNGLTYTASEVASATYNAINFEISGPNESNLSGLLVYRPPKSNRDHFLKDLAANITGLRDNAVLMGDFNIDLLKPKESSAYANLLSSWGFRSLVNQPTREVFPCASCIDHVHVRTGVRAKCITVENCSVLPNGLSDHHAVLIELGGLCHRQQPVNNKHTVKFINWESLNASLDRQDWKSLLSGDSVNGVFGKFYAKLNDLLQLSTKIVKKSSQKVKRNPWASSLLVKLAKQKNDLYLLVKKYPQNEYLKLQYKKVSKKVQLQTSLDKTKYFGQTLDDSCTSPRKYWQLIGKLTGRDRKGIEKLEINSALVDVESNQLLVANEFNEYFVGVTQKLAAKFTCAGDSFIPHKRIANSIFIFPISPTEIFNAINSIANKNSPGSDGVGAQLIKNCIYSLLTPLEILFNLSLTKGIFPDVLKNAIVVPVFKAGISSQISNYRPISILSAISKILELIIKNRIIDFLTKNHFFSDRQFGFLPGRSTDGALMSHITDIVNSTEKNNVTVALYLDITKAFDTVDHDILLEILSNSGLRGPLLSWFSTYLKNRKQTVRIGDVLSTPLEITSGVPQGSTLGPILFLIYVNELLELKISGRIFSFADDTAVLFSAKSKLQLVDKIRNDLNILTSWFWSHKLYPNLLKTKVMSFGFQKIDLNNLLKLHISPSCFGSPSCECPFLEQVSQIKYLGLILDEKLNWEHHSGYLQGKLRKLNFMLYHTRRLLSRKHLIRIYKVLYEPILRYGIIHWGHSPKKYTYPIRVLQKHAIRILASIKKQQSTLPYFLEFNLLNFEQLLKFCSAKYAHKYFLKPELIVAPSVALRDRGILTYRPKWSKDISRAQAAYSVSTIFNSLPLAIREIQFHGHFSSELRRFLIKKT